MHLFLFVFLETNFVLFCFTDGMIVSHFPYGPTAYFSLHNVGLRHDIENRGTVSEQYPHLIFDNFSSTLGARVKNILKFLFPVPKPESQRAMTFSNSHDFISFRHHVYQKYGHNKVELMEVGPRFEMKCKFTRPFFLVPDWLVKQYFLSSFFSYLFLLVYQITLGTVDIAEADKEWVYRPYMNTTKKRDFL
jgi:U3 small nucleolar ribonucleoprotein protein IMP4